MSFRGKRVWTTVSVIIALLAVASMLGWICGGGRRPVGGSSMAWEELDTPR